MTYKEIKNRLEKCEDTLLSIKNGTYKNKNNFDLHKTTEKLELLQESLRQKLADAVEFEDEKDAAEFAQDNPDTPVKVVDEMKPGDEEDLERRRFDKLSREDQNTLIAIRALIDKEKAKHDTTVSEQPADAPADLSEVVDPSITQILVDFVALLGMGYGAFAAAKKLSNKHGDIDLDSIKAALSKKEEKDLKEDLTVVGHTPEEEKRNAEELVTVAKKAGRDAKIKYDGDSITGVDIGAPGLGTPDEVQAVQDRQFDDYHKNKPKDDKGGMHKPARLRKLTVGGKTYEIGDFDPNDDGRIMSIEKYPNGYYITGGVYTDYGDGDEPKEGYGYALSLDGKEMDEEDLEGMYEGEKDDKVKDGEDTDYAKRRKKESDYHQDKDYYKEEKDDYGRPHVPEKGTGTYLSDDEVEKMKKDKLGMNENEIGDADDNVGMGYKNARDIINYLREKIYPYMNDKELEEFNDEMNSHFASSNSRFVKEGDNICSCCGNPIVNGSCGCPDDCPHCGGKGKVNEGVGKTKKAYDLLVSKMKELAKQYKAGDKSVVDQLKDLTAKKRKLEDMLDQDVSNIGRNQELTEGRGDMEEIHAIIRQRAIESGESTPIEAAEIIMDLADTYDIDLNTIKQDYFEEGKYKSDAQRKAIYATKAEKGELKEGMDLEEFEREYLSTEFGSSLADDYPNTKKYSVQSLFNSFKELRKKKNYDFEEFFELIDNGKIKKHSASKLLKLKAEKKEGVGGDLDLDKEILSYIADTYIQNAKDGDATYSDFRDLHIDDAVQDVVGILHDPKHPLFDVTRKQYNMVNRDKRKGLFEENQRGKNIEIFGYETKHFEICPGATELFTDIKNGEFTDGIPSSNEQDKIVRLAKLHDILFAIEKIVLKGVDKEKGKELFSKTLDVASDIYELGSEIGLDENHRGEDLDYIQTHVEIINDSTRDDKDE